MISYIENSNDSTKNLLELINRLLLNGVELKAVRVTAATGMVISSDAR